MRAFKLTSVAFVAMLQLGISGCGERDTEFRGLLARGRKAQTLVDEFKGQRRQARRTDKEFRERKRMENLRKKEERKIKIEVVRRELERKKLEKEKRVFEKKRVGL